MQTLFIATQWVRYQKNGDCSVENSSVNTLQIEFSGDFEFINTETLLELEFLATEDGSFQPELTDFNFNSEPINWTQTGHISIFPTNVAIGDTITMIQRPLQNIPAIVRSGEEFEIQCIAPDDILNWEATLTHDNKEIELAINQATYHDEIERWVLIATVPSINIFELYDLQVIADNTIIDKTVNSVSVINDFKSEYYFVHITDTHLPTHYFYPDEIALTDSSEMVDLREVINDINLIHPEFVLLTGDLVNEGELEDFENRRYYTKAQRLLQELEVPCFLVSGNHDLGGWTDTPPQDGTARRNWWKFFGWNYLENPYPAEPYYTQNYTFSYDNIMFIGLESYDNYDGFMNEIYGWESFTSGQINWLEEQLAQYTLFDARVLFYHYDFSDQLNLNSLGVEMALWGHVHSNNGSIYETPYNLSTDSTCDGERAYRIINVNNNILQPTNTVSAGWDGENLTIEYSPANDGNSNQVTAHIENNHNQVFNNAIIKFVMPFDSSEFEITNGTLEQIDSSGLKTICYVRTELQSNSSTDVICTATETISSSNEIQDNIEVNHYPNPFFASSSKKDAKITFEISGLIRSKLEIRIYNLLGKLIKTIESENVKNPTIFWDGKDENNLPIARGIYFFQVKADSKTVKSGKILIIK